MPKSRLAVVLALVFVTLITGLSFAQQTEDSKQAENSEQKMPANQTKHFFTPAKGAEDSVAQMGYLKFLPDGYLQQESNAAKKNKKPGDKWPLMVFLHGAGERGTDLELVKKWGPPKRVLTDSEFPFVLISPQCPSGTYWNTVHLNQLIDQVVKEHRIDTSRIYITGLSMGGYGTWKLVAEHPEKFAAAIPICGGGDPTTAKNLTKTPIWAFHGEADRVVKVESTTKMVDAIKEIDGTNIKVTIYPGVDHNSWSTTYSNPKIYEWLLSHKR